MGAEGQEGWLFCEGAVVCSARTLSSVRGSLHGVAEAVEEGVAIVTTPLAFVCSLGSHGTADIAGLRAPGIVVLLATMRPRMIRPWRPLVRALVAPVGTFEAAGVAVGSQVEFRAVA